MKAPPTPEEKNPKIGQLRAKSADFDAQRSAQKSELTLVRGRRERDDYGNAGDNQVRRLLGQTLLPDATSDKTREGELLQQIHDLNVKIEEINRVVRNEIYIGARLVLEDKAVKDELGKSGNKITKALIDLHGAMLEHDQNLDALEDVNCDVGQYRINLNGLGSPRDLSGGFWYAMRDLIDAGYMSKSDLPKVLR